MNLKSLAKPLIIIVGTTALAGSVGSYVWKEEHRPKILEIYVFGLKSGRSMFVRTPEDKRILIDGGSNSEIVRYISKILPFYSKKIDMVISTNTEGKNIVGLIDVIKRFQIEKVYLPTYSLESLGLASSTDKIHDTFLGLLEEKGLTSNYLKEGDIIDFDSSVSSKINFPADPSYISYSKSSFPETLFDISFGKNSFIFLGNASNKVQKYIASKMSTSTTNVLIVSHSALPANISKEIISKIKPKNLIFSKRIVKQTRSADKEIFDPLYYLRVENKFNTREKGTIKIVSDGYNIKFFPFSI